MAFPVRKIELTEAEKLCCQQVKTLRRGLGMTLVQFARQLGCTPRSVIRWERGDCVPGARHLKRLAQLAELNERVTEPNPKRKAKLLTDPLPERSRRKIRNTYRTSAWYRAGIPKAIWRQMTKAEQANKAGHMQAVARVLQEHFNQHGVTED